LLKIPHPLLLLLLFLQSWHPGLPAAGSSKPWRCERSPAALGLCCWNGEWWPRLPALVPPGPQRCRPPRRHRARRALQTLALMSPPLLPCTGLERYPLFFLGGAIFADHQLSPTSVLHNLLAGFKKRSCIKCV